jgi:hypothetical protein
VLEHAADTNLFHKDSTDISATNGDLRMMMKRAEEDEHHPK